MSVLSRLAVSASNIMDPVMKSILRTMLLVNTVAAAGSDQTDATALTAGRNAVTGADDSKGVILPKTELDMAVTVINTVSDKALLVYPDYGSQINALTATTGAFTVVAGSTATFYCDALGHWYTAPAASVSGTLATLSTEAAAGITGGTGTIYKSSVTKSGGIITTSILLDLTGLGSSTTDLDIIGQGASAAHLGQITAARNGTIVAGRVTCLKAPAGGVTDIDLYSAAEATGKFDDAVTGLTETALLTKGGAWSASTFSALTAFPAADEYLYLTGGAGGTAASYTAGKFLIELYGY